MFCVPRWPCFLHPGHRKRRHSALLRRNLIMFLAAREWTLKCWSNYLLIPNAKRTTPIEKMQQPTLRLERHLSWNTRRILVHRAPASLAFSLWDHLDESRQNQSSFVGNPVRKLSSERKVAPCHVDVARDLCALSGYLIRVLRRGLLEVHVRVNAHLLERRLSPPLSSS